MTNEELLNSFRSKVAIGVAFVATPEEVAAWEAYIEAVGPEVASASVRDLVKPMAEKPKKAKK
jgi:hypothetical protein